MLSTRRFNPQGSISLRSTTKIATHLLLISALAVSVCCLFSAPTFAQGSLSLGTVQDNTPPGVTCDPTDGWYFYSNNGTNTYLTCKTGTVSCPNTQAIGLKFGYLNPAGVVPGVTKPLGTIVVLSGDGGVAPGNFGFADAYFKGGYEIVEAAWATDWEQTYDPFTQGETASIQNAACRPASFLSYVYTSIFPLVQRANSNAAYCAHGASAGSAQIAYSLAYYGAGGWLDNVELISGPVFSDIKQGCEVPAPANVTICGGGQYGCQLGGGSSWSLTPSYVGVQGMVGQWTNDMSCRGSSNTSAASNAAWLAQSIVDQSTGAIPTFNYPSTGMSAWLCRTLSSGTANNSSPQGEIFYAQIGQNNSPPNYAVYAVDQCPGAENVGGGSVPGFYPTLFTMTPSGSKAVVDDMMGFTSNGTTILPQCTRRTH